MAGGGGLCQKGGVLTNEPIQTMYPKVIIHRLHVPAPHRRSIAAALLQTAAAVAGFALLIAVLAAV